MNQKIIDFLALIASALPVSLGLTFFFSSYNVIALIFGCFGTSGMVCLIVTMLLQSNHVKQNLWEVKE